MKNSFLVTGGAGFIGSHLVDHLLAGGAEHVTIIDDFNDFYDPQIKHANIGAHKGDARYRLVEADIRDRAALEKIFADQLSIASFILRRVRACGPSLISA
jgi:UDP-glucuronate 4-epimerase